jgi:hypothetical protein
LQLAPSHLPEALDQFAGILPGQFAGVIPQLGQTVVKIAGGP